jgi:hypothetical protein
MFSKVKFWRNPIRNYLRRSKFSISLFSLIIYSKIWIKKKHRVLNHVLQKCRNTILWKLSEETISISAFIAENFINIERDNSFIWNLQKNSLVRKDNWPITEYTNYLWRTIKGYHWHSNACFLPWPSSWNQQRRDIKNKTRRQTLGLDEMQIISGR